MNVNRIVEVRNGEPVDSLREFMTVVWQQAHLDAVLAPFESQGRLNIASNVIDDPVNLAKLNPFAPVMVGNAALAAVEFIEEYGGKRIAIFLRPCELRSFMELKKRRNLDVDPASTIVFGVDCLGTYSRQEYIQLVEAGSFDGVTADVLRNAGEGGLRPQHFRMACQICDWSGPVGADISIGTIGVDSDNYLLVIVKDEATDDQWDVSALTDNKASEYQVSRRETVVGAIADTRADVRDHLIQNPSHNARFDDLGSFLAWLANCSLCGRCLNACPLYRGEFKGKFGSISDPALERHVLSELVNLGRWIASCAGCGMCEQACERDVPLTLLLSSLRHRIRRELKYHPGDPLQQTPWY